MSDTETADDRDETLELDEEAPATETSQWMLQAEYRLEVPPEAARARLDQFLAESLPDFSRSRLQALVREGHVTLDGAATKPSMKLTVGSHILVQVPPAQPARAEPEDIPLEVLFEDEDFIVVNKPAGMVVHGATGHWRGTLVNALLHHCGGLAQIGGEIRPGIVHRLDKETSGCLMAAKNDVTHRSLVSQLANREVGKIYLALAAGRFMKASGMVDEPIARHPVDRKRMAVAPAGKGKEARTGWRVLGEVPVAAAPGKVGTLVECTLYTGRTHQIRVHLKHLGHPILGDKVYGEPKPFARQMLHAWRLSVRHPRSGQLVECTAPLPEDFRTAGLAALLPGAAGP